jgi:hypothetical protein
MKYTSPAAFRQALEDRLRTQYPPHRIPRVRKMIAFERFMARLDARWILKGGYALQLRTESARTTQDIDLLALDISPDQITEALIEMLHRDYEDHFDFYLERTNQDRLFGNAMRFRVTARLAGRVFERFHIDIGMDDPIIDPIDHLVPPAYLDFAEIAAISIPCYPITQHLAEKLHALVRPRPVETSRVKDFVDILLFAGLQSDLHAARLLAAIQAVFQARGDQIPAELEHIPTDWRPKYNQFTRNLDLPFDEFDQAVQAAQDFINPILDGTASGIWNAVLWEWSNPE